MKIGAAGGTCTHFPRMAILNNTAYTTAAYGDAFRRRLNEKNYHHPLLYSGAVCLTGRSFDTAQTPKKLFFSLMFDDTTAFYSFVNSF